MQSWEETQIKFKSLLVNKIYLQSGEIQGIVIQMIWQSESVFTAALLKTNQFRLINFG